MKCCLGLTEAAKPHNRWMCVCARVCACVFKQESNFFPSVKAACRQVGPLKCSQVSEGFQRKVWLRANVQWATVLWAKCHVDARGQRRMARLVWDDRKANSKISLITCSCSSRGRQRVGYSSHRLSTIREEKIREMLFWRVTVVCCQAMTGSEVGRLKGVLWASTGWLAEWHSWPSSIVLPREEITSNVNGSCCWTVAVKSEGNWSEIRAVVKQAGPRTITKIKHRLKDDKRPSLLTHWNLRLVRK